MYPDKGNFSWIEPLQLLAVLNGYKPVFRSVKDVRMAVYFPYPFIGLQLVPEQEPHRQYGEETLNGFSETIIGCIEYQVPGRVFTGQLGGKATAKAPSIYDDMVFMILGIQSSIYILHIAKHVLLTFFPGAFPKSTVVNQNHIIFIPVEILGIPGPAFDTSCITVKIKDKPIWLLYIKMQSVDPHTFFHIKK